MISKSQIANRDMAQPAITNLKRISLLVVLLAACVSTPTPTPPPVSLTISSATAMTPLLTLVAERFQMRYPSVTVIIEDSNSFLAVEQVTNEAAALGAVSVAPPDGLWSAPIAVDGIAVIVHPDNPLDNLTLAQVHDVFGGRVWQWSDLGVEVAEDEIAVASREEGSGTRLMFEALAMTLAVTGDRSSETDCRPRGGGSLGAHLCEGDPVTSMAVLVPGSTAVVDFVAAHPGAIGYVSRGHVGSQVKAVRIEDMPPTLENIADGGYYLTQPFFLIAPQEPTGVARQFVDFCLSAEGQEIVALEYVPVRAKRDR